MLDDNPSLPTTGHLQPSLPSGRNPHGGLSPPWPQPTLANVNSNPNSDPGSGPVSGRRAKEPEAKRKSRPGQCGQSFRETQAYLVKKKKEL